MDINDKPNHIIVIGRNPDPFGQATPSAQGLFMVYTMDNIGC